MRPVARITSIGVVSIIVFDVIASLASRSLGFPYGYAAPGSWLIYAIVGFVIGRIAPVAYAIAGVANVALAEATLGWWLSWVIGPGRIKSGTSPLQVIVTIVTAVFVGAVIGAIAGATGGWRRKVETRAP